MTGDYNVDEFGFDEDFTEHVVLPLLRPLYRSWFRVEVRGVQNLPETGGALLVANHAGAIPPDAPVIMHGIETELDRPVYGLADHMFRDIPVVGTLWSRAGGVVAHPDNAYRLLHDQGQLVLVFPEGIKGPGKHVSERYRLRRFGRGGFVEIAMRAGVPIIPLAIVGSEDPGNREAVQRFVAATPQDVPYSLGFFADPAIATLWLLERRPARDPFGGSHEPRAEEQADDR